MINSSISDVSTQPSIESLHTCGHVFFNGVLEQIGWLFYLVSPHSSMFDKPYDVPNYEVQVINKSFIYCLSLY